MKQVHPKLTFMSLSLQKDNGACRFRLWKHMDYINFKLYNNNSDKSNYRPYIYQITEIYFDYSQYF